VEVAEPTYVTRKREVSEVTRGVGTNDVQEFFVIVWLNSNQNVCRV
jgi:hypothetical protein